MDSLLHMIQTGALFLGILSLLVFIHELGHFLAARIIGVKVEEFGLGLPPRAIGKLFKGTIYSLNWLPIGGFVRLAGEDEEDHPEPKHPSAAQKQMFWARSKKERSVILLAGVTMNLLLAIGVTTGLLMSGYTYPTQTVVISATAPESPAALSGLMPGDIVESIAYRSESKVDQKSVEYARDIQSVTNAHLGKELTLRIRRDSEVRTITVVPRTEWPSGQGPIGITLKDTEEYRLSLLQAIPKAIEITYQRAHDMIAGLGSLVTRLAQFQNVGADVAGPIGIAQVTAQTAKFGFKPLLDLMTIISLNLALLNALPIPALDGGRLLFVFIEKIAGHKVRPAFERYTHQIGMLILYGLLIIISVNDIFRLFK